MIDKSNMRKVILDFPKQFRAGLNAAKNVKPDTEGQKLETIIICGMGGSALPGELLKLLNFNYFKAPIGIYVHPNYGLPFRVKSKINTGYQALNSKSLVVCMSYSGNTEETLSSYEKAIKNKLAVASIASGGKLLELSKKNKTPIAIIPAGVQPRLAFGYQCAALIKILENLKLIKNCDKNLLTLEKSLKPKLLEKEGKKLAQKLAGKTPIVYSSLNFKALAYFWKIKFNENTKIPAFWNYFPELNHNEMAGFTHSTKLPGKFYALILEDPNEHPQIRKRMRLTADIIKKSGQGAELINLGNKNILEKVFSNYIFGDWISYYLALNYGIDPTPVTIVEEFKKRLK